MAEDRRSYDLWSDGSERHCPAVLLFSTPYDCTCVGHRLSAVIGVIEELEAIQALGNGKPPRGVSPAALPWLMCDGSFLVIHFPGGVAAGASRFRLTLDAESAVTHSNLRSQSQPGVRL